MPGPAPKDAATRRRTNPITNQVQEVPMSGRSGPTPEWPIPGARVTVAHQQLWAQLWKTPAAVVWERLGWSRTVARYVLVAIDAETTLDPKDLSAALQLETALGLTPQAIQRMHWKLVDDSPAEVLPLPAKRERLTVVD